MQTGYYASAAGMVTQFNRLDNIANNLANVNTAGFKEDNLVIGDFMKVFKEARDEMPNANNSEEGAAFINRTMTRAPQVTDSFTNHSLGTIEKTSNDLDFALSSEGLFFVVKTPQGVKLTRDGSFTKNDEGTLVTKQGYEVLPSNYSGNGGKISIAQEDNIISVDKNGNIYTNVPGSVKMNQLSSLFIAEPKDVDLLKKEGDNLYAFENIDDLNIIDNSGAVSQGYIEKSNVNAVKMMTQMIETNRLVGMYQKVMSTQMDDMNRDAIEKLAKKA
ncbi:flagellar hook-basal body protein [Sulfurimonas sp.]|jgi:flagellar basal-body rod protein FlgF|uniref:flagellar hook-basal body protein n=1 Tax=Sulfurimonas sp. TaxID=2022749 RepID=UPI0025FC5D1C|nr:flagellar hook-basal body protein [Sulfurimonas sp.]MBT5935044.1 flagellar hook-basal body protein [Sulfurimonas sp.]